MTGGKLTSKTDASTDSLKLEGTGTDSIWTGGSIENLTIFIDDSDAGLDIADSGGNFWNGTTFINDGHINWIIGDLAGGNGSTITNNANFNDSADARFYNFSGGTAPVFTNASTGTYNKTGSGTTEFDSTFDNSGTVNVNAGILKLDGGGTTSATGSFAVASGATLQFDHDYTVVNASALTGLGQFQVTGGTVTLDGAIGVNNFLIQGGVIAGTHTFTNGATWTDGSFASSGTTTNDSGSVFNIGNSDNNHFSSRAFVNNGTMNWTAGALTGGTGSTITNNADFNDSADARFYNFSGGTAPVFTNTATGTYNKTGSGTTEFDSTFDNSGTVNVNAGILKLDGGGTTSATGSFAVASGATLQFDNTYAIADASRLTGLGQFQITGGTVTLDGAIGVNNFLIQGGVIAGTHTFTNGATWTDGSFASSGTTTNDSGSVFNISNSDNNHFSSRAFVNNGIMNWTAGALTGGTGSTITNNADFNDSADARFYNFSGGTAPVFTNNSTGTYNKTGSGTTEFDSTFDNSGTVNINAGILKLDGGGTTSATGSFAVASGATLQFDNTYAIADASRLTGLGQFQVTGGTVTLDDTIGVNNFLIQGGVIAGTHTFTNGATWTDGSFASSGTTTNDSGSVFNISNSDNNHFSSRAFVNNGIMNWTAGALTGGTGSTLTNNATFNDSADARFYNFSGGTAPVFTNASTGTYNKTGSGTTRFDTTFNNSGTINVNAGTLVLAGGGSQSAGGKISIASNAVMEFAGDYTISGDTVQGDGQLLLSSGSFFWGFGKTSTPFQMTGGTLRGGPKSSSSFDILGGSIGFAVVVDLLDGAQGRINTSDALSMDGSVIKVDSNSSLEWSGGNIDFTSPFSNVLGGLEISGLMTATDNGSVIDDPNGSQSFLKVSGSFRKTGGSGTTTIGVPLNLSGRFEAHTGSVNLTGGGTSDGGIFDAWNGTSITFTNGYTFNNNTTAPNGGNIVLSGGTFNLNDNINLGQHALVSGGTLTGTHTLSGNIEVNGGVFDSSGSTTIGSGAAIKFSHVEDNPFNRTFNNGGQMDWTNSDITGSGGNSLVNSGTFNAATDGSFTSLNSDFSVTNSGSFGKTAGTGTTIISVPFTNQGRVFANTGTLHFADTFTFTSGSLDPDGGRISFAQTLQLPTSATLRGNGSLVGNFQVGGNVSPGNSIGSLHITGDLTLLSTSTSFFEVNASTDPASADLVSVSGTLTLNGNLSWDLLASLDPIKTDTFTLYSAGNLTGSFLNVANGGRVYTGDMQRSFVVNYGSGSIFDPNSVVFSNFEFTPIPEPSTWALMITGLWLIAWRGGRSRARRQRS